MTEQISKPLSLKTHLVVLPAAMRLRGIRFNR